MQSLLGPQLRFDTLSLLLISLWPKQVSWLGLTSLSQGNMFLLWSLGICWHLLSNNLIFHNSEGEVRKYLVRALLVTMH